jgi:cytochrome c oxidase cbb3-type subunit III
MRSSGFLAAVALIVSGAAVRAAAQPPDRRPSFPAFQRALADPAVIERGSTLYGIHCRLCHGPDLRGGDLGGVNLLRSQLVLNDQGGELIGQVVKEGKSTPGSPPMPALALPDADLNAVAAFIHSTLAKGVRQGGPPPGPPVVLNIVVGDPTAGERYFAANCGSCHSVTGDLQGLAVRYPEPMQLQNAWVGGTAGAGRRRGGADPTPTDGDAPARTAKPATVTVTMANGQRVEGRLEKIDDFIVVLTEADGTRRSFRRVGTSLGVQISDPLAGHKQLLVKYTDKDIHDVTAYLVTLK